MKNSKYSQRVLVTAIASPSWTEMKMTPAKAQTHTRKSILSIFQMWYTAGRSIRPITATIIIAPRTTFGVYTNNGMRNNNVIITVSAMITLDMAVLQPALWFTAERENAPDGYKRKLRDHISTFTINMNQDFFMVLFGSKNCTCCYIAGCAWAHNVHQPYGHHFFVSIYLVAPDWSKCSTNCYSFLIF